MDERRESAPMVHRLIHHFAVVGAFALGVVSLIIGFVLIGTCLLIHFANAGLQPLHVEELYTPVELLLVAGVSLGTAAIASR